MVHNHYQQPGGEDESFAAEARLLESRGHQVERLVMHNSTVPELGMAAVAAKTVWNGASYRQVRTRIRACRPDVLHAQNVFPLISPSVCHAAKAEGVPVVQSIRNYRLFCLNGLFYRQGQPCEDCLGRMVPWPGVARRCYRQSVLLSSGVATMISVHRALGTWRNQVDLFIALTAFVRDKLIAGGIPPERIAVKPNFLSEDPGVAASPAGDFALFAGRLSPEKGVSTLINAWRHIPGPLGLRIIGDGPFADQARALAAADPRIVFLGRMATTEVQAMMRDAAAVIVPSEWYETFGRVVIEAFASGVPVLAARIGAIAELVEDGRTGRHFRPGDPEDLARRLLDMVADPAALRLMRRAARSAFEERFCAAANYEAIMRIYASVIPVVRQ